MAPNSAASKTVRTHILTVLVEDYFQAPAFRQVILEKQWSNFEGRVRESTQASLELLRQTNARATFFVSSWTAQQVPDLIREIVRQGHEIGSSGKSGVSFRQQTEAQLQNDARYSRAVLEDISGQRINGYRVADRRLTKDQLWALRVLAEEGYHYDSSFSPNLTTFRRDRDRQFLHRVDFEGASLWELPLPSISVASLLIPIAGGNYVRQIPEVFVQRGIRSWINQTENPFIFYFRVWDLDPRHPKITGVPLSARVRHYRNAEVMPALVRRLLSEHSFTTASNYLGLPLQPQPQTISVSTTSTVPTISLSETGVAAAHDVTPQHQLVPFTVVVPCYNEETSLPYLLNSLRALERKMADQASLHFVFVDDGSQDRTWDKLHELFGGSSQSTLIRHAQNQGIAAAILTGIRASKTEIVASIDCDCTYDPTDLENLLPLLQPGVACVTASPYHPDGHVFNVPAWRRVISGVASKAYQVVLGVKVNTFTSCFRLYRRSAVVDLDLQESGFVGVAELLGLLLLRGQTVVEYPATLAVRVLGYSKMKVVRTTIRHLRLLGRLALQRASGHGPVPILSKVLKGGVSRG